VTGTVRVWVSVVRPQDGDAGVCSADERERAARLPSPLSAGRWLAKRAALRRVLAAAVGAEPAGLSFSQTPSGKLLLELCPGVHFNLSHTGDAIAIAVADRQVGVDIERPDRRLVRPEGVADRLFGDPSQRLAWSELAEPHRTTELLRRWTRAEALLKATGEGVAGGLAGVEARLAARGYVVRELALPELVGAVAAPGTDWVVATSLWP
jgi:4'-phosphopantetheinyl transferase